MLSPRCCYYKLKLFKITPGRRRGRGARLHRQPGEAWTHRDIYIQSDRLPGIVSLRALMSDPLLPVQKGERHVMTMGPKQDKEEMFKFRPLLPSSPLSRLWSCLVFVNSSSFPPWAPSPHCVISIEGFSHSTQIPKEDQLVRPEFSQSLVFTDVPLEIISASLNPSNKLAINKEVYVKKPMKNCLGVELTQK